jgi:hypothetical protein
MPCVRRFNEVFLRDEAGLPRAWSARANIPAVTASARAAAARLLAQLAVLRIDPPPPAGLETLEVAISELAAAKEVRRRVAGPHRRGLRGAAERGPRQKRHARLQEAVAGRRVARSHSRAGQGEARVRAAASDGRCGTGRHANGWMHGTDRLHSATLRELTSQAPMCWKAAQPWSRMFDSFFIAMYCF